MTIWQRITNNRDNKGIPKWLIIVIIWSLLVIALGFLRTTPTSMQSKSECVAIPLASNSLVATAGQLIYQAKFENSYEFAMFSTASGPMWPRRTLRLPTISPDGTWIAGLRYNLDENADELVVREVNGHDEYVVFIGDEWDLFGELFWIGETEVLTTFQPLVAPREVHPLEVVNFITGERHNVGDPLVTHGDGSIAYDLHFGEPFSISPNYNYLAAHLPGIIYDIGREEIVAQLSTWGGFTWSPKSDQVAFSNIHLLEGGREQWIHIYNIQENKTTHEINLEGYVYAMGWSPDGRELAYKDFNTGTVGILTIETGEVTETCLQPLIPRYRTSLVTLVWSRDGRYLATYGRIAGQESENPDAIHIYDRVDDLIYQIDTGKGETRIVGWGINE